MSPRRNWDSPNPPLARECAPPPRTRGGGAHSPAGEGLGESQFRRLEKKLSTLPTLICDGMLVSVWQGVLPVPTYQLTSPFRGGGAGDLQADMGRTHFFLPDISKPYASSTSTSASMFTGI
jgi:hypothetical protein